MSDELTVRQMALYDLTRATHQVVRRTPPHIERAVLSVRRRLEARATPQTRYGQIGAAAIREELRTKAFDIKKSNIHI
jgi:hypothetical protein